MRLEDLDYFLPESSIAQIPLADRSASRLLWLQRGSGMHSDRMFREVPSILERGDLLVVNDTRVTARRLIGEKSTGGAVELLLLRELESGEYEALARPGRRLKPGAQMRFGDIDAWVVDEMADGRKRVRIDGDPKRVAEAGEVPLPPYIHHRLDDPERYQTVYAAHGGSAAAPTAGLHFTPSILEELSDRGVGIARVTLDVGLDTFRPITADDPLQHSIHGEVCAVPEETQRAVAEARGRIIAVGTTAVRTLESLALDRRKVSAGRKETRLYITPGYSFQVVDGMFTNFHMPRTTMLLMLSAMARREAVLDAYRHAVEAGYRFLSFGDSMLIL